MIKEIIFLVLGLLAVLLNLVRQFQMLQQNSYFASRYSGYLKGSLSPVKTLVNAVMLGLVVAAALYGEKSFTSSMLLFSAVGIYFGWKGYYENEKSIKKLVYTPRIKRMFLFAAGLLVVIAVLGLVLGGRVKLILYSVFYLFVVSPVLLTFLTLFALKPFEKAIGQGYVRDAKKILKETSPRYRIGITGSYGKTGTKYILSRILSEKYNTLHTPESFNTPMGVVKTVRELMRADCEVFIAEMGAKKKGDIKEICDIVLPNVALITSVGPQHLDTFKNIETVADTKFELADSVENKSLVFANGENEIIRKRCQGSPVILYGFSPEFKFRAENIEANRYGLSFTLVLGDEKVSVSAKLLGKHNILNIVGAAALSYSLGVPAKDIAFAISRLAPVEHRLEMKQSVNGSLLIDDAYNSNPEGCLEAVNVLSTFKGMQKVIITPGLVELGDREYECNKSLGFAAAGVCDKIILVGKKRSVPLADGVKDHGFDEKNLFVADSFKNAMEIYSGFADKNTVVLLENDLPDNYLQ